MSEFLSVDLDHLITLFRGIDAAQAALVTLGVTAFALKGMKWLWQLSWWTAGGLEAGGKAVGRWMSPKPSALLQSALEQINDPGTVLGRALPGPNYATEYECLRGSKMAVFFANGTVQFCLLSKTGKGDVYENVTKKLTSREVKQIERAAHARRTQLQNQDLEEHRELITDHLRGDMA